MTISGRSVPRAAARDTERVADPERTDGELIERVGDGYRDAFDELYRRYARSVLGLALRRLNDRGRAEDALQDAFAAVWRSAGTYDAERGTGGAWLYTVARNSVVDSARRRPRNRPRSNRQCRPKSTRHQPRISARPSSDRT